MKITIATGLYPPEIGGPATYTAMLERELPAYHIEVTVVPFGWVRHYPKIIRHFVYAWKLWQESRGSDCIYALDPVSVGLPALLAARLRGAIFLLRVPGDYAWEQGQLRFGVKDRLHDFIDKRLSYGFMVSLLCRVESCVAKRAKKVVVPSKYMKRVVQKWGVEEEKIHVIYSALYPLAVSGTREELRSQLEYSYPTLVSAGRLVPNKGFLQLVEVFSRLKKYFPEAQLIIIGEGPQREELIKHVGKYSLTQSVRLVGNRSKEALGASIKAADVFVLNTAHEGLSHQLLEVMDIGTPVVTTAVGGNPELITNGVEGYLVEFNNAEELEDTIARVLNHPESVERLTQSARARSKKFSQRATIQEIVSFLNKEI